VPARKTGSRAIDRSGGFDFDVTDEHNHFDDPTELPPPWTPPPDPEFPTGVLPQIERADLSEPADSPQETVRFSRHEVQELVATRTQSRKQRPSRQTTQPRPARQPRPAAEVRDDTPTPPPAAVILPPRVAMKVPSPPVRLVVAHRWQIHHVAIAFALGLLTGVLAVIAALALA
jgi:hypothetical protein